MAPFDGQRKKDVIRGYLYFPVDQGNLGQFTAEVSDWIITVPGPSGSSAFAPLEEDCAELRDLMSHSGLNFFFLRSETLLDS